MILVNFSSVAIIGEETENTKDAHTVFVELKAATNCGYCPYQEDALTELSGDYEFVLLACSSYSGPVGYNDDVEDRIDEINTGTGFPTSYYDGGYQEVVGGGTGSQSSMQNALNTCAARTVADVDLDLSAYWLGDAEMNIELDVINTDSTTYQGHVKVYITEIVSRWNNNDGQPFDQALLSLQSNEDISVNPSSTWSTQISWDGDDYGYGDITMDNIKIFAVVFDQNTMYVDEALSALPQEITGPTLTYTPLSVDVGELVQGETTMTTFDVRNSGSDILDYTVSSLVSWLSVSPTSGSCEDSEVDTLTVTVDTAGLSIGGHTGELEILSNGGDSTFSVDVHVNGAGSQQIDLQQNQGGYSFMEYGSRWAGQSFKPTIDTLSKIELLIGKNGVPADDVTVSIRSSLAGDDIVSITLPESHIPETADWFEFDLPDMSVISGDTYYIVVHTSGGNSANCYIWSFGYGTPYTDGAFHFSSDADSSWTEYAAYDMCFRTFGEAPGEPPVAEFSFLPASPSTADTIQFTDESTDDGTIVSWDWDFDDSSGTSTDQDPTYSYGDDGTYSVTLTVTDDDGLTDTVQHPVTVSNVPPVAVDDSANVPEDTPTDIDVTSNDHDSDGTIDVTTVIATDGTHGTTSVNGVTGIVTYTPDGGYIGSDSFTYTVDDDDGATSGTATVYVTVIEVEPPNAEFSFLPASPSTADTIQFTDESTDDGTIVSWDWDFDDGSGTSTDQDPTYSYGDDGVFTVTLTVWDNEGASDSVSHPVTVSNVPPVAVDDISATTADVPVDVVVTSNDHDSDGTIDVTTVVSTDGTHGTTSVNGATGVVTYTPETNYIGSDSFTYTVDDDDGATSNVATVSMTITGGGPTEDVVQDEGTYSFMVYGSRWAGQSFIPSIDELTMIELLIGKNGVPAGDLTVSIRSSLTGADIESITVPESSIPETAGWVEFDLPDMDVTSGNTYYIVVHTSGGNSVNCYTWNFGYNTPYTDGAFQFSSSGGSSWTEYLPYDFCFITYGGGGGPPVPVFSYDPTSHDFGNMFVDETDSTTFDIWNSGTGTLTYSLSESCSWVDISSTSGSSTGEHDTITVDIDTTGLSETTHSCDIVITSDGGSGTFTVDVNVIPPSPMLSFSPTSHDFGNMLVDETDSTTFDIWNSGTGILTYGLSESCGWVDVTPAGGDSTGEHDTITVSVDTTGLSDGSYDCDISISSDGGNDVFSVDLEVVSGGSEILDVEQSDGSYGFMVYGSRWAGQSFIPSIDSLTKVKLLIGKRGTPGDDLTVSIRSSLTGADIESITVPESSIQLTATWIEFDLPDMSITSGNTYYIVAHSSGGNSANCYVWSFGYGTPYTDGALQFSSDADSSWTEYLPYDFCFKTYGI